MLIAAILAAVAIRRHRRSQAAAAALHEAQPKPSEAAGAVGLVAASGNPVPDEAATATAASAPPEVWGAAEVSPTPVPGHEALEVEAPRKAATKP